MTKIYCRFKDKEPKEKKININLEEKKMSLIILLH